MITKPAAEWVRIGDLLPWERNPKAHPTENVAEIARSIVRFGFTEPIIPWRSRKQVVAGHGFSSLALANAFPGASVTATNLPTSVQWAMAEKIRGSAFRLAPKAPKAKVDMIFASEYFEHFDHPLDHLEEVLGLCQPRIAVVANAFTAKATGHFDRYTVGGASVDGKTASKRFNDHMRAQGYAKLETGFWNNRPVVWVRQ